MALFDFFGSKRKAEAEQKIEEQKQEQHDEAVARQRADHPEMHWPVITPINMFVKKPGETPAATPGAAATAAAEAGANTAAGSENAAAAANSANAGNAEAAAQGENSAAAPEIGRAHV